MLILIPKVKVLILVFKIINIAIINIDVYYIIHKLKRTQVFIISIKNLKDQEKKKSRSKIDLKSIIIEEYHNFLEIFFKKNLDILLLYQKYNHKIILQKKI